MAKRAMDIERMTCKKLAKLAASKGFRELKEIR